MSSEAIARVVADLRSNRVRQLRSGWHAKSPTNAAAGDAMFKMATGLVADPVVVDATPIYDGLAARSDPVAIYEDHPCIAPPWDEAAICYVNEHGNVIVMHVNVVTDQLEAVPWEITSSPDEPDTWETLDLPDAGTYPPIDNDRLRWRLDTFVWIGGRGGDGPVQTTGPVHLWQFAVYADGEPADLHWVRLVPDYPVERWDMAHLVLLGALNFMSCTNVELVVPPRPRAESRRIARTGVEVHTINVRPAGGGRGRHNVGGPGTLSIPLTPVRGNFHHYGDCCPGRHEPKGLLFGRLEGKYWVPPFARGDASVGESKPDYRLVP